MAPSPDHETRNGVQEENTSSHLSSSCSLETNSTKPPPTHNNHKTVILFDWDDTLMASSWLASNRLRLDSPEEDVAVASQELSNLSVCVQTVLLRALDLCDEVHLVTNAEIGWVEMSCELFLPGCVDLLSSVQVVSARTSFEHQYPDEPTLWKIHAFQRELTRIYGQHAFAPEKEEEVCFDDDLESEMGDMESEVGDMDQLSEEDDMDQFSEEDDMEVLSSAGSGNLQEVWPHETSSLAGPVDWVQNVISLGDSQVWFMLVWTSVDHLTSCLLCMVLQYS